MTTNLPVVNASANADTFQNWVNKTNDAIQALNQNAVTVNDTANGAIASGNAHIDGILSVLTFRSNSIGGGNVQSTSNLSIESNVVFSNSQHRWQLGLLTANGSSLTLGSNISISTTEIRVGNTASNIAMNGTTIVLSGNLTLRGSSWSIGNSSVNASANSSTLVISNGQFLSVTANVVTANQFSGNTISFENVTANVATITTANVGNVNATTLTGNAISGNNISGSNGSFANLSALVLGANSITSNNYSGNGSGLSNVLKVNADLGDVSNTANAHLNLGLGGMATKAEANVSEIAIGTANKGMSVDKVWEASKMINLGNISGSYQFDGNLGSKFYATVNGNLVVDVKNMKQGQSIFIVLIQDAVGGRSISWNAKFLWPDGASPVIRTVANNYACIYSGIYDLGGYMLGTGWKVNP